MVVKCNMANGRIVGVIKNKIKVEVRIPIPIPTPTQIPTPTLVPTPTRFQPLPLLYRGF